MHCFSIGELIGVQYNTIKHLRKTLLQILTPQMSFEMRTRRVTVGFEDLSFDKPLEFGAHLQSPESHSTDQEVVGLPFAVIIPDRSSRAFLAWDSH